MPQTDAPRSSPKQVNNYRRAVLLRQVEAGPLGQGEANARLSTRDKNAGLSPREANRIRDALAANGYLAVEKSGRLTTYRLTESGAAYLEGVRGLLPLPAGVRAPANEGVRDARIAVLLAQLFCAPGRQMTLGEANKFNKTAAEVADLNRATARHIHTELATAGYLTITPAGRTQVYALTPAGRSHLASLTHFPDLEFSLTGANLADLLAAAREPAASTPPAAVVPSVPDLPATIVAAFAELRRERFAVTGLVPIHEVRAEVRRRLGTEAGRHDVFDAAVLDLWRAKTFRLVPISGYDRATPEELQDSIPGRGETLFYLEAW